MIFMMTHAPLRGKPSAEGLTAGQDVDEAPPCNREHSPIGWWGRRETSAEWDTREHRKQPAGILQSLVISRMGITTDHYRLHVDPASPVSKLISEEGELCPGPTRASTSSLTPLVTAISRAWERNLEGRSAWESNIAMHLIYQVAYRDFMEQGTSRRILR